MRIEKYVIRMKINAMEQTRWPGRLARSDTRPTGNQEVAGSIQVILVQATIEIVALAHFHVCTSQKTLKL